MTTSESPALLDIPTAARELSVSASKVRRLVSSGELPSVRIGGNRRIRTTDLADFIKRAK